MKRFLFPSLTLLVCFFTFVNLTTIDQVSSFVVTTVSSTPDLPSTPFAYSEIEIPSHLFADPGSGPNGDPGGDLGYGAGGVDSTAFDLVTDDGSTLGRVLFYDEKLSALENISCASCHDQSLSFTENKQFSEGISAPTRRNSMHLNDIAWTNNENFFWDMSQTNLHEMIRLPLTDENEIGADMNDIIIKFNESEYYPELFQKAFGDPLITEDRVVSALVQFIMSMNTFNSRFDQQAAVDFVDFTAQEHLGKEIFSSTCTTCHSQGKHGSDEFPIDIGIAGIPILEIFPFFFNNGLPEDEDDRGAGEWNEGLDGLFKVPSLRNIELTAPYMHDGRFSTIEEVIDFYSEDVEINNWDAGFIPEGGFQFSDEQKLALAAFLRTLTDVTFLTNEIWSNPFAETTTNIPTLEFDDLIIKPNPMRDVAAIEFENSSNELVSVNIFTADGKLLKHDNIQSNQYLLNKNDFGKGMYFVELIMGDRKSTQKLIVQ